MKFQMKDAFNARSFKGKNILMQDAIQERMKHFCKKHNIAGSNARSCKSKCIMHELMQDARALCTRKKLMHVAFAKARAQEA